MAIFLSNVLANVLGDNKGRILASKRIQTFNGVKNVFKLAEESKTLYA
jgi:hypothetical protein